jgi:hypothetical protein
MLSRRSDDPVKAGTLLLPAKVTLLDSKFNHPPKEIIMFRRKAAHFRSAVDLRDKVQVKVLRKRLKLSEAQLASAVRKSGNSITALVKHAADR